MLKPDIVIFHNSYLKNNYNIIDQLINTKKFIVIYYTALFEIGYLYSVIDSPRFFLINDSKANCCNEIIKLMQKNLVKVEVLEREVEKYKDIILEEKILKKAKLFLIKKGYKEEEAYKLILKKSMNERITKKVAAQKILEEGEF